MPSDNDRLQRTDAFGCFSIVGQLGLDHLMGVQELEADAGTQHLGRLGSNFGVRIDEQIDQRSLGCDRSTIPCRRLPGDLRSPIAAQA